MAKKSSFDMYENLLLEQGIWEDQSSFNGRQYTNNNDEDVEGFITSKELVKKKETPGEKTRMPTNGDGIIEESFHFQRYNTKRREHKYTKSEMEKLRESCHRTIVHDYGEYDIYHISDEERIRNDQLAEISMKIGRLKRTYRRVDQYIEAMRIVFQAWEILERTNYVHSRDEFFEMVADGKIVSNRIIMPKLKKMNQYNTDMIIRYISNPELDPSHLVPKKPKDYDDDFFDDDEEMETPEERMARFLSEEEAKYILDKTDNPERIKIKNMEPKYIRGYDRRTFKKKKKENKRDRRIRENLAEMLNKIQNGPHYRDHGSSYMVTNSFFEPEKREKTLWDDLYFDGSWGNKNDVMLYDLAIREEMLKQHPPKERHLTYGDKELDNFFKTLEDNGVSTIDLRTKMGFKENPNSRKVTKVTRKENKKIENAVIQRLTELNKSSKFKKTVKKAEEALEKYMEGERK